MILMPFCKKDILKPTDVILFSLFWNLLIADLVRYILFLNDSEELYIIRGIVNTRTISVTLHLIGKHRSKNSIIKRNQITYPVLPVEKNNVLAVTMQNSKIYITENLVVFGLFKILLSNILVFAKTSNI